MRLATIRNSIREGFINIIRHPLVTLASITTIALMLLIMGAFSSFSLNARVMMERFSQQPPLELTLKLGIPAEELKALETKLAEDANVLEYQVYTPEQNLASFKSQMEDDTLFEGFEAENLPFTITVRLNDPAVSEAFAAQYAGVPGVHDVSLEIKVMEFLSKAIVWVNYATLVSFVALLAISLFIIYNMVRVAIFSRAEEINIMKYVGATNWYVGVPYVVEGAMVGLIGAIVAFVGIYFTYSYIYDQLMEGMEQTNVLAMLPVQSIALPLLGAGILTGMIVGAIGSVLSVRKYVKV
ncbi:MAG: ABC transporter permease [Ruminococcaceae bacterium]|nr:ABC transporter permease [Oscillospiraceae bacterium]